MNQRRGIRRIAILGFGLAYLVFLASANGQLIDKNLAPNTSGAGINKTFTQEVGAGRGNINTPDSSIFIINRDPFRSIRRGRQLFQRKFTKAQGQGHLTGDGSGDISADQSIGAGLADSCALCHGLPKGSAGHGGQIAIRPDNRNAPHLFGLGLQEMLADEITSDLRAIRDATRASAIAAGQTKTTPLVSKGINYGTIRAFSNGSVDDSGVVGVNADLRVRPFFAEGKTMSIHEFVVGALNAEMGLESFDPDLVAASEGAVVVTPSGMVLDGTKDQIESPPAKGLNEDPDNDRVKNEIPVSIIDHFEFYLLHYFKPAIGEQNSRTSFGGATLERIGCTRCHIPNLQINRDRRIAMWRQLSTPSMASLTGSSRRPRRC